MKKIIGLICFLFFSMDILSQPIAYYGRFQSIPANAITPHGWLRQYLINQRNGLTGHLEKAGYPFNTVGWAADSIPGNKSIEKWWPYEQNAYWVDGMIRCGLLLNDTSLLNKARKSIYYVLGASRQHGLFRTEISQTQR